MNADLAAKIDATEQPDGWYGDGCPAITREACRAAQAFVDLAMWAIPGLGDPRVGPSVIGAVALQWDLGDYSLVVRVPSADPTRLHFQEEGPNFHQEEGEATWLQVVGRLASLYASRG